MILVDSSVWIDQAALLLFSDRDFSLMVHHLDLIDALPASYSDKTN